MYNPLVTNISKKYGNNRWKTKSLKIDREVFLYSDLEYDNWLTVECNPSVIKFCEQPFLIKLPYNNTIRTSIPDMWILYDNGDEEIVEVKYSNDLIKNKVKEQIEIQQLWATKKGIRHKIVTEREVRVNRLLLSNYKSILSILKNVEIKELVELDNYLDIIKAKERLLISEFSDLFNVEQTVVLKNIAFLLYRGQINANLDTCYFGTKLEVSQINGEIL